MLLLIISRTSWHGQVSFYARDTAPTLPELTKNSKSIKLAVPRQGSALRKSVHSRPCNLWQLLWVVVWHYRVFCSKEKGLPCGLIQASEPFPQGPTISKPISYSLPYTFIPGCASEAIDYNPLASNIFTEFHKSITVQLYLDEMNCRLH